MATDLARVKALDEREEALKRREEELAMSETKLRETIVAQKGKKKVRRVGFMFS